MVPCQKLPDRFAVGMYFAMMFCAVGSSRFLGMTLPGNGALLSGSTGGILDCEKSPLRSSAVGTMALFRNELMIWRRPEYVPKKNVLFLRMGPPMLPPY